MPFTRVVSGNQVGSLAGMIKKVKWGVLDKIYLKYDIKYDNNQTFNQNKKRMVAELIDKMPEHKIRKLLIKLEDEHIQPALLKKFKQNRDNAIYNNLIRYTKNQ